MGKLIKSPLTAARPVQPKARVYFVRQPVKSVRPADQASRLPMRLVIGTLSVIGGLVLLWLLGHLGQQLGFGPAMRVPEMTLGPGAALALGARIVFNAPMMIFQVGIKDVLWLGAGFVLVSIPAAGLGAARPTTPGGPKLPPLAIFGAYAGATCAAVNALLVIIWTAVPLRTNMLGELPFQPGEIEAWTDGVAFIAGIDTFALIAATLWVVLTMRLPLALWARSLSVTISFFALAVTLIAFAASSGAAAQLAQPRSLSLIDDEADGTWRLVLGETSHELVTLTLRDVIIIERRNPPELMQVIGGETVRKYIIANRRVAAEE